MTLAPIAPPAPPVPPSPSGTGAVAGQTPGSFGSLLTQLNGLQLQATSASNAVATGQSSNIASAVVAAEKAALSLQLAVQVRTTALQAYQTISQVP